MQSYWQPNQLTRPPKQFKRQHRSSEIPLCTYIHQPSEDIASFQHKIPVKIIILDPRIQSNKFRRNTINTLYTFPFSGMHWRSPPPHSVALPPYTCQQATVTAPDPSSEQGPQSRWKPWISRLRRRGREKHNDDNGSSTDRDRGEHAKAVDSSVSQDGGFDDDDLVLSDIFSFFASSRLVPAGPGRRLQGMAFVVMFLCAFVVFMGRRIRLLRLGPCLVKSLQRHVCVQGWPRSMEGEGELDYCSRHMLGAWSASGCRCSIPFLFQWWVTRVVFSL